MINIIDKFFLTGEKSTPEMRLQQHGFTYIACQPLTERKTRIQKFKAIKNIRHIYQNKLENVCFNGFWRPQRSTQKNSFEIVSCDKVIEVVSSNQNGKHWCGPASVYKFIETPLLTQGLEYIALHSSITKKFNSCNVYASNLDKIYAAEPAEPADMQLLLCNREVTILLCVGEAYRKCVWIIPWGAKRYLNDWCIWKKYIE